MLILMMLLVLFAVLVIMFLIQYRSYTIQVSSVIRDTTKEHKCQ
jgi:hypothetical protein